MRVDDAPYPGAGRSLETKQVNPDSSGNDDWKAKIFDQSGAATLSAFNGVSGITLMGWVKPGGVHPNPDSTTAARDDTFGAAGLFGLLSGTSEGHLVRALLEVMQVSGSMRLVALGRREDDGESLMLAATDDWDALLPVNTWTILPQASTTTPARCSFTGTAKYWAPNIRRLATHGGCRVIRNRMFLPPLIREASRSAAATRRIQ